MSALLAVFFGLVALFGFGVSDFIGAIASRKLGAFRAAAISRIISLLILLGIFFAFFKMPILTPTILFMAAIAGILFMIAIVAYFKGFKVGNVSIVAPIGNSWAVITIPLSVLFLNQAITNLEIVSAILIILGAALASIDLNELKKLDKNSFVKGTQYAVIALLAWGFALFVVNIMVQELGWFLPTLLFYIFMSMYFLVYFKAAKMRFNKVVPLLWLLALVAVLDLSGFLGYSLGVATPDAAIIAPVVSASPLITVLLAIFVLKEKLKINQGVGVIAIILGLVLISL